MDLDKELENALQVCNNLSRDSKEAGDLPTMYSANRAWNALFEARNDLTRRRNALAPRSSKVTNGDRGSAA